MLLQGHLPMHCEVSQATLGCPLVSIDPALLPNNAPSQPAPASTSSSLAPVPTASSNSSSQSVTASLISGRQRSLAQPMGQSWARKHQEALAADLASKSHRYD